MEPKMGKKNDLPKGCQWPAKISALISEIKTHRPTVDVRTSTSPLQAYFQKDREQMKKVGNISILDCFYSPDGKVYPPSDVPLVTLWVQAVKKEEWVSSQLQSEQILRVLREHLEYVSRNQAWDAPWQFSMTWLGKSGQIECKSRINRLKSGEEALTRHVGREL